MASPTLVFKKSLKKTDLKHRLSVPTRSLRNLPGFEPGQNRMSFWVLYERSGAWFNFHFYKRKKGSYSKPVFSKGWIEFAKLNHLRVRDVVTLHKMESPGYGPWDQISVVRRPWYQIRVVRRSFRLFGVDINI